MLAQAQEPSGNRVLSQFLQPIYIYVWHAVYTDSRDCHLKKKKNKLWCFGVIEFPYKMCFVTHWRWELK